MQAAARPSSSVATTHGFRGGDKHAQLTVSVDAVQGESLGGLEADRGFVLGVDSQTQAVAIL